MYIDGIGAGVTGSAARRGGESGETGDSEGFAWHYEDESGEALEALPTGKLAYFLDILMGGGMLTFYLSYLTLMIVPAIRKQNGVRTALEETFNAKCAKSPGGYSFFRRLHVEESNKGENFKLSYRLTRRRLSGSDGLGATQNPSLPQKAGQRAGTKV